MNKDQNRLRDCFPQLCTRERALSVESYISWYRYGDLELNANYQRDYVWTQKEQDAFLVTLVSYFPVGIIAISDDHQFKETKWIEVIDGKQRLTTIIKFYENEIGLPLPDGSRLFWRDMTLSEQRKFRSIPLPALDLQGSTEKQRLEFFYRLNFAGVPQSEEHKKLIMEMMK